MQQAPATIRSLYGLQAEELANLLELEHAYQGRQIYRWLTHGATSFTDMTDLPKAARERLSARYPQLGSSRVTTSQTDESGAVKLLIGLSDGLSVECVLLTDKEGRKTACLSSQVGCAMGCTFCRTATMGLLRNLSTSEIIEQFVHIRSLAPDTGHIVFMGMGEPMANLSNVAKAIQALHDPDGFCVGLRRITISTCGLVPGILRLAKSGIPVKLAVSLVSADDALRSRLMPVNKAYPLEVLRDALLQYQQAVGKRFTLEYVMLGNINTSPESAYKLSRFMRGMDAMVNLIPWNPAADLPWETPSSKEVIAFTRELDRLGIHYTRRTSRGRGVDGACGQLAVPVGKLSS